MIANPGRDGGLDTGFGEGGHVNIRIAELPRRFKSQVHGLADVLQRRLLRIAVGRASRKFGRLGHGSAGLVAPIDDDFVFVHRLPLKTDASGLPVELDKAWRGFHHVANSFVRGHLPSELSRHQFRQKSVALGGEYA